MIFDDIFSTFLYLENFKNANFYVLQNYYLKKLLNYCKQKETETSGL